MAAGSTEGEIRGCGETGQGGDLGSHWAAEPGEGQHPGLPTSLGTEQGRGGTVSHLLVDVAGAALPALLPAAQLARLQQPGPGAARPRPRRPRVQLLEAGAVPKVFRA